MEWVQKHFRDTVDVFKHGGGLVHVFQRVENRGLGSLNRACFVRVVRRGVESRSSLF